MDTLLKDILLSPKLPDYIQEMQEYLQHEQEKRNEFYEIVRDDEKAEFINGEIVYHSPAKHKHTVLIEHIGNILSRYVRKQKLGIITREKALVQLRRNDFEPDICFFRKEVADQFVPETMFYPAPDFVAEVLSSSTESKDRGIKFIDYALNGVKEYWIVDPNHKFIEQYFLEGEKFVLAEKVRHGTICCKVIAYLEIPLAAIFNDDENESFLSTI